MKKEIILLSFVFLLVLLAANFALAATRTLEVVYPEIPGVPTPKTVTTGLPEYVNYIFNLALIVIGFVILGALIYSGIIYLTSAGNPAKLSEAKSGILAGLLGGVILLSAYLIFYTINPQLVNLIMTQPDPLKPMVMPGIYVCNYEEPDIDLYLEEYLSSSLETKIEGAKKLKGIMDTNKTDHCLRANLSGNFQNFVVESKENTFFSVPGVRVEGGELKYDVYEYGIVLHEKDNFGGQCKVFPEADPQNLIYRDIDYLPEFEFKEARSVTLFQKLPKGAEPSPDAEGVILYECLDYNNPALCPKGITNPKKGPFRPGGVAEIRKVAQSELKQVGLVEDDYARTKSTKIDPQGSFFGLFFEGGSFDKKCGVIKGNYIDLTDHPIGRCGATCYMVLNWVAKQIGTTTCIPCTKSIMVIKGQTL